jgi:hypothetical protein
MKTENWMTRRVQTCRPERARVAPRFVEAMAAIYEARGYAAPEIPSAPRTAVSQPVMAG